MANLLETIRSYNPFRLIKEVARLKMGQFFLTERLSGLESFENDLNGWNQTGSILEKEFSRNGLAGIMATARLMFLANPLINRSVTLKAMYVFGRGFEIKSEDETLQKRLEAFLNDPKNQAAVFSHQACTLLEIDLECKGNLFFVVFRNKIGDAVVRTLRAEEIETIIFNPDDALEPRYYVRRWKRIDHNPQTGVSSESEQCDYYPDYRYDGSADGHPEYFGSDKVHWDSPVMHVKVGGMSDMAFGVPETYQAHNWARAYTKHLENWATITQAYAQFAFQMTVKGGAAAVQSVKAKIASTLGNNDSDPERNPPYAAGSTWVSNDAAKMSPMKTAGATTSAEDGRRLLLMVASSFGMPETFYGDMNTSNLATAKAMDRPTELGFQDRQMLYAYVFVQLCAFALGGLEQLGEFTRQIKCNFPPILEHDTAADIGAIVDAATLKGNPSAHVIPRRELSRIVLERIGAQNVEQLLDMLEIEWQEADDAAAERAKEVAAAVTATQAGNFNSRQTREAFRMLAASLDDLHKAISETKAA